MYKIANMYIWPFAYALFERLIEFVGSFIVSLIHFAFQCVARPVLCIFVVTLLIGGITYSRCKCNYSEILSAYKALILIELQNLVREVHRIQ